MRKILYFSALPQLRQNRKIKRFWKRLPFLRICSWLRSKLQSAWSSKTYHRFIKKLFCRIGKIFLFAHKYEKLRPWRFFARMDLHNNCTYVLRRNFLCFDIHEKKRLICENSFPLLILQKPKIEKVVPLKRKHHAIFFKFICKFSAKCADSFFPFRTRAIKIGFSALHKHIVTGK